MVVIGSGSGFGRSGYRVSGGSGSGICFCRSGHRYNGDSASCTDFDRSECRGIGAECVVVAVAVTVVIAEMEVKPT